MSIEQLAGVLGSLREQSISGGLLDVSHVGQLLELVHLVGDLSALRTIDISTPEGVRKVLLTLLDVADKAASLTPATSDNAVIAKLRSELDHPEVLAFLAYLVRRLK